MDARKRKSKTQEERVAKQMNGRVTPASGALWGAKGDVKSSKFLIECKTTDKVAYPLTKKTWNKIWEEALRDNFRVPVMCIELIKESYAVLLLSDFESLIYDQEHTKLWLDFQSEFSNYDAVEVVDTKQFRITQDPYARHYTCKDWGAGNTSKDQRFVVIPWSKFLYYIEKAGVNNE